MTEKKIPDDPRIKATEIAEFILRDLEGRHGMEPSRLSQFSYDCMFKKWINEIEAILKAEK